ncbi:hypothetical protein BDR04DRAFT_1164748 [Suillus decipiens]|nr:hypothetical protein BDR04DRAFT_1164748 [Suillus decipiens]
MALLNRSKAKCAVQGKSSTLPRNKRVLLKLPVRPLESTALPRIKRVLLKLPVQELESTTVTDANLVSHAASQLQGKEKRRLGQETKVPCPNTGLLKRPIRKRTLCSNQWDIRRKRHCNYHVHYWQRNAPVYRLKGVRLEDLKARSKNNAKETAQATIDVMESWESDGASGIFQDELGKPLLAYFAQRRDGLSRPPEGTLYYEPGPNTPSAMGRSPADFAQARAQGEKIHFDGINSDLLNKTLVSTQLLLHHLGTRWSHRDGRHDKANTLLRYVKNGSSPGDIATPSKDRKSFTLHGIEYMYHDDTFTSEATGVIHLVHAWPDQGRSAEKVCS